MTMDTHTRRKYITNPLNDTQLLAFDLSGVTVHKWDDLSLVAQINYEGSLNTLTESHDASDNGANTKQASEELLKVIVSHKKKYIVLAFSKALERVSQPQDSGLRLQYIRVIRTSSFDNRDSDTSPSTNDILTQLPIPEHVAARMEMPLAMLNKDRLIFLDNKYWICTWQMDDGLQSEAAVRKHFFLPRDWIGAKELKLCTMSPEGSLLYPRNGQVALVQSNLATLR